LIIWISFYVQLVWTVPLVIVELKRSFFCRLERKTTILPAGNLIQIHRLMFVICKPKAYFPGTQLYTRIRNEGRMATALSPTSHLTSVKGSAFIPKPLSPPLFTFHSHRRRFTSFKPTKIYAKLGKTFLLETVQLVFLILFFFLLP
jgi:hypothetical protein